MPTSITIAYFLIALVPVASVATPKSVPGNVMEGEVMDEDAWKEMEDVNTDENHEGDELVDVESDESHGEEFMEVDSDVNDNKAEFALGARDSLKCPEGYEVILPDSECEAAAKKPG